MRQLRSSLVLLVTLNLSLLAQAGPPAQPAPKPKPKVADVARPMAWLLAAQNDNGGWGAESKTTPDVASTALATITLIRYGHTLSAGEHREATRKGVEFVVRAIERVPRSTVAIQGEGTQPQAKLGRYIDTFLAAQLLGEAVPTVKDEKEKERLTFALDTVVEKVQALQRQDGSFDGQGWAPVLSSAFANGGLYAARKAGSGKVAAEAIKKSDDYMAGQYDTRKKAFKTEAGAGVALYGATGSLAAASRQGTLDGPTAQAARAKLKDESFLRGYGTYGGEEHVSYMMTSEALARVGGEEWKGWDEGIRTRLAGLQRENGTWRGDHCITSTTFCTAASLVTLAIKPEPKPANVTGSR